MATVKSLKADVSSVSPSSEREWRANTRKVFVVIVIVVIFVPRYLYYPYLFVFSVESRLHIFTSNCTSTRQIVSICIHYPTWKLKHQRSVNHYLIINKARVLNRFVNQCIAIVNFQTTHWRPWYNFMHLFISENLENIWYIHQVSFAWKTRR